jgi:DNA-directed RNA polymerase subunit RPC12/RpoP
LKEVGIAKALECAYCGSREASFVDYARVNRRIDKKHISVTEVWECARCRKEFEWLGTLYSPQEVRVIELKTAVLSWVGYFTGSIIAYMVLYEHILG